MQAPYDEDIKRVRAAVEPPKLKGMELAWVFRCRGCQSCGFDTSRPHWLGLDEIPDSQYGEP